MSDTSLQIIVGLESSQVKTGLDAVKAQFTEASGNIERALSGIKGFVAIKHKVLEPGQAYDQAKLKVKELARQTQAGSGSVELTADFQKAKAAAAALKQTLTDQEKELHVLRQSLALVGVSTDNLIGHQRDLRGQLVRTKEEYKKLSL